MRLGRCHKFVISIIGTELVGGGLGSIFTFSSLSSWYFGLNKPSFAPSGAVIGIVWTILYLLMGVSVYLVWIRIFDKGARSAIVVYLIQLGLNALWPFLFFYLRSPFYGLIGIGALWLAVLTNIVLFYRVSKGSAALLVPYIVWVSIAAVLNYYIFILNPILV